MNLLNQLSGFKYESETLSYRRHLQFYRQRVTDRFTVFLADKDSSVVGFEIVGISQDPDAAGNLSVALQIIKELRTQLNAANEQLDKWRLGRV